jgi:hypothetical protein
LAFSGGRPAARTDGCLYAELLVSDMSLFATGFWTFGHSIAEADCKCLAFVLRPRGGSSYYSANPDRVSPRPLKRLAMWRTEQSQGAQSLFI